ncbi:MAG: hypothetical protein ACPG6V_07040 [Flavobacteriales bacterium]
MIIENITSGKYNTDFRRWVRIYLEEYFSKENDSTYNLSAYDFSGVEAEPKILKVNLESNISILEATLSTSFGEKEFELRISFTFGNPKVDEAFQYTINDCVFKLYFDLDLAKSQSFPPPYDIEFGYDYYHWCDDC